MQHLHGFDVLDCFTQDKEDLKDGSNREDGGNDLLLAPIKEIGDEPVRPGLYFPLLQG